MRPSQKIAPTVVHVRANRIVIVLQARDRHPHGTSAFVVILVAIGIAVGLVAVAHAKLTSRCKALVRCFNKQLLGTDLPEDWEFVDIGYLVYSFAFERMHAAAAVLQSI